MVYKLSCLNRVLDGLSGVFGSLSDTCVINVVLISGHRLVSLSVSPDKLGIECRLYPRARHISRSHQSYPYADNGDRSVLLCGGVEVGGLLGPTRRTNGASYGSSQIARCRTDKSVLPSYGICNHFWVNIYVSEGQTAETGPFNTRRKSVIRCSRGRSDIKYYIGVPITLFETDIHLRVGDCFQVTRGDCRQRNATVTPRKLPLIGCFRD